MPYEYYGPAAFDVCSTRTYPFESLLRLGGPDIGASASGYAIESVWAALKSMNYDAAFNSSGGFDPALRDALLAFQRRKGLIADGTLGPQTWTSLHDWTNHYEGLCP